MISAIGFDGDEFDRDHNDSHHEISLAKRFSTNIFSPPVYFGHAERSWVSFQGLAGVEHRLGKIAQDTGIKPLEVNASGEIKADISWGDKDGVKVSVGAAGQVSDDKGNYIKGEIKQDNNGQGSASVSAGHENDAKSGKNK